MPQFKTSKSLALHSTPGLARVSITLADHINNYIGAVTGY